MDTAISPPEEQKEPPTLLERVLINRNYAYNWLGLATSRLGNVVFKISILLWVATTLARNAPWAAFALGGLVFLPTAVFLVVSTFAGVYIDRWDARRTQLVMDATRAISFTLLLTAIVLPSPFPAGSEAANLFQLVCVYIAVMINSACDPFVNSALAVILYDIVDEPNLPRAFGRGQVLMNLGTIFGPPLGAAIFFLLGIQWTILFNVFSFVVSFFAFYMVRLPSKTAEAQEEDDEHESKARRGFLREFTNGLRFTFGNKMIVAIAFAMLLNAIGAAGIGVFDLYFATNNLHASPQVYAYLDVVMGVGAILGALFLGPWLRPRIGMARAYWMTGITNGLLLFLYARLTNLTAAFIVLFLYGMSEAVFAVAFGPILFRSTPRGMMGRVNSVLAQLITIVSLVSLSFIPFLVAVPLHDKYLQLFGFLLGPIDVLFMAVAILMITSAFYLRVTLNHYAPELRKPIQQGEGQNQPPSAPQQAPQGQSEPSQVNVLRKQIAICVVGLLLAVLVVLPVTLSTPANAVSNLKLSRGHPATGQTIDGIPCQPSLGSKIHANVRLTVYVNGQSAGIPVGIGSVAPPQPGVNALASNGKTTCLYALHVFEADNLIHVDAPTNRTYTLGQFFDIWGQPLSRTQITDYSADANHSLVFDIFDASGTLQTYTGDPRAIPLAEHETIVILYNSSSVHPVPYTSWNGL
ncbi:MAG: MFS transporter [Ktedonobacteraceae bacterium]|nr:MFS transporter [Ktedonobacteraceae bacterium]